MDKEYLIHNIKIEDNPDDQHRTVDIKLDNIRYNNNDWIANIELAEYANGEPVGVVYNEDVSLTGAGGGGGGDATVTINNITGNMVEIYVAESIEALVGGTSETMLIAAGESTQTFTAGSVFAFEPDSPLEVSINSGDITLKDYMGIPYWEVGGNGSILISSTI